MLVPADVLWLLLCATAYGNKVHSLQQLPDLQAQPFPVELIFARPILAVETEANGNID